MILLQSFERWTKVALFDPVTGEITWRARISDTDPPNTEIKGDISRSLGRTLILYRRDGALFFRTDDQEIEITDTVQTTIETWLFWFRRCTIKKNGHKLFSILYRRRVSHMIPFDPTPIEEDHVDFCLFVHNVLSDPKKIAYIYRNK